MKKHKPLFRAVIPCAAVKSGLKNLKRFKLHKSVTQTLHLRAITISITRAYSRSKPILNRAAKSLRNKKQKASDRFYVNYTGQD